MAKQVPVQNLSIRAAARYLQDNGVDIGEMRMRSLIRQHPVFTTQTVADDPLTAGAFKTKIGNSEIETWEVKPSALDAYIQAVRSGTVRNAGSGKKFYRIQLDAPQFEELRAWAAERNIAEPTRANSNTSTKGTTGGKASKNGASATESLEGLLADMDENEVQV